MRKQFGMLLGSIALFRLITGVALAHPASGIVVDEQGQVFFIYTGHGVFKIDTHGKLSLAHETRGGHWMCLDLNGVFSNIQPKFFERITPAGAKPAIIFADGGAPIAMNSDGNLYYGSNPSEDGSMPPGGLSVSRISTNGTLTEFAPSLKTTLAQINQGVTGLATEPGGVIYVACPSAIYKVRIDGTVSTFLEPVACNDCDPDPADHIPSNPLPYLRGLAVDSNGTVYAAATSCHRVLKITPSGLVETFLKTERPWSPTGVALHGGDVYVLEYTGANGGHDEGWLPRVRKVAADGKVSTIVTMSEEEVPHSRDR
jgi:sugar lactone lactonase YvrE